MKILWEEGFQATQDYERNNPLVDDVQNDRTSL